MDFYLKRGYSMKKICEYLGVSRDAVLACIENINMHAAKIECLWKFNVSEVDYWINLA